jgi:hypothetical protein
MWKWGGNYLFFHWLSMGKGWVAIRHPLSSFDLRPSAKSQDFGGWFSKSWSECQGFSFFRHPTFFVVLPVELRIAGTEMEMLDSLSPFTNRQNPIGCLQNPKTLGKVLGLQSEGRGPLGEKKRKKVDGDQTALVAHEKHRPNSSFEKM